MYHKPNKDELLKIRKIALIEKEKAEQEYKNEKKHKIKKFILIFILFLIVFKITVKEIVIPNVDFIKFSDREYKVLVNNVNPTVIVRSIQKTVIIPFFVYFETYNDKYNFGESNHTTAVIEDEKVTLNISSYECYGTNQLADMKIDCNTNNKDQKKIKMDDLEYTMIIKNANKIIYNGKLLNDITNYITEKQIYNIEIYTKYNNIYSTIKFEIQKK